MPATAPTATAITFPAGFFAALADQSMDALGIAATECQRRAQSAPGGSKASALWTNRYRAINKAVTAKGWQLDYEPVSGVWYASPSEATS